MAGQEVAIRDTFSVGSWLGGKDKQDSGAGGTGVVLVRYADDAFQTIGDLTLQKLLDTLI